MTRPPAIAISVALARSFVHAALAVAAAGCADGTHEAVAPAQVAEGARPSTPRPPQPSIVPIEGCPGGAQPKGPVEYGVCKLQQALARASSAAKVDVLLATDPAAGAALAAGGAKLDARAESYAIVQPGAETVIVGRDAVGAMYGAFDLIERLAEDGAAALPLRQSISASPAVGIRAANPFLVLPAAGEASWWFLDTGFWTEFLDMMARARLDFLDMHGMYNLENTVFPNALLWFSTSASAPSIGVPQAERDRNLAMLGTVVQMAEVRGIRVGLMSYRADLSPYGTPQQPALSEPQVEAYTREAVATLTSRVPGLAYFGFRVGESKRSAAWFTETYLAGLASSRTQAKAYTRSWMTPKSVLAPVLASAGPEAIVEAKYNGEQLGPPYIIAGGQMPGWKSYSYQDFLTPPDPFKVVLQIRAAGTHRIFRYASYARTARVARSLDLSPRIAGFTFEAAHAYSPQRDFYHADPKDAFSAWTFRRDEMAYLLFGRLGYDPSTPEAVFRGMLAERVGTKDLWDVVQAASDIVPWMQTAYTCGPDQRDYAAELELGGSVGYWAQEQHARSPMPNEACHRGHSAFDSFAVAMPYEAAEDLVAGRGTSRLSPVDVANLVIADAKEARRAAEVKIDPANAEARDYVRECVALSDLGEFFGHKLRGATALAVYERSGVDGWREAAMSETALADAAFKKLADDTSYIAPFDEALRMKDFDLRRFHWRDELRLLVSDPESISAAEDDVRARPPPKPTRPLPQAKAWLDAARDPGPGLAELTISPQDARAPSFTVTVKLAAPAPQGAHVSILHRPFASDAADWVAVPATALAGAPAGTAWSATVPGTGAGMMAAVEIQAGQGRSFRYPDVRKETPYRAVAP
jgi:hypothetical protein